MLRHRVRLALAVGWSAGIGLAVFLNGGVGEVRSRAALVTLGCLATLLLSATLLLQSSPAFRAVVTTSELDYQHEKGMVVAVMAACILIAAACFWKALT
jgi:hypothetical protein